MKNIEINEQQAKELYKSANAEIQKKLELAFGSAAFITDANQKVKTFEDACDVLGISSISSKAFAFLPDLNRKAIIAYYKLTIIAKALNGDWVADWENAGQHKYYPYFAFVPGVGFRFYGCGLWVTRTGVGSRLCYRTPELAKYAGTQFEELYNELLSAQ